VNGKSAGKGEVKQAAPVRISAIETLDIGMELDTPVSANYREEAPFKFTGEINPITVTLAQP
jgi:hypothetical protein